MSGQSMTIKHGFKNFHQVIVEHDNDSPMIFESGYIAKQTAGSVIVKTGFGFIVTFTAAVSLQLLAVVVTI